MTELDYGATQLKIERENEEKLKHYPILQKQLEIAVKCLKQYANRDNWYNTYKPNSLDERPIACKERWKKEYGYKQAEKTLEKIEELNK